MKTKVKTVPARVSSEISKLIDELMKEQGFPFKNKSLFLDWASLIQWKNWDMIRGNPKKLKKFQEDTKQQILSMVKKGLINPESKSLGRLR